MRLNLSIRAYIAGLIVGCLVPLLIFSAILIVRSADREQVLIARSAVEQANRLATDLDRRLRDLQAPLFVLANSPTLQKGNFAAFHDEAAALARRLNWTIALIDRTGQQIVNTRQALGTTLPRTAQTEAMSKIVATGLPYISDLTISPSTGEPAVGLVVPVGPARDPAYFLVGNVINQLSDILARNDGSDDTVAAIVGRDMRVIARAPALKGAVGSTAQPHTIAALRGTSEGWFDAVSRMGEAMHNTFSPVAMTGWTVVVSIPRATLFAPVQRSIQDLVAGGGGLLMLALGITALIGRRLVRRIHDLSGLATALGRGAPLPAPATTGIRELDEMAHSLAEAAGIIRQRSDEREAAFDALKREAADRLRVEKQLVQAQKMEAIGQLTGGIAHDFNNIIGAVIGNLEVAADHVAGNASISEPIDEALKEALRAAGLTRRLLAFARQQTIEPQAIELNGLVSGMVGLLRRSLGAANTIVVELAPDLWIATADPALVEDALLNLAINARDAMPHGGTLTIRTCNSTIDEAYARDNPGVAAGEYVNLTITDTGTGMPQEVIERAFEPFFTTKEAGKGSGLGLSMVYGFAKQCGGHLRIYSEVGHGTTVHLFLPRRLEGVPPDRRPAGAKNANLPTGTETILLVDDEPGIRRAASRMLRGLGYRVLEAADAASALVIIDNGRPIDLLLTDLVMPGGVTGVELAAEASKRFPGLPVLLTSGYAGGGSFNGWAHSMIVKPYSRQELATRVRASLDAKAEHHTPSQAGGCGPAPPTIPDPPNMS